MFKKSTLSLLLVLNLSACGTSWEHTRPNITGLEQILISTAADRAANKLTENSEDRLIIDSRLGKSFIDAKGFDYYEDRYIYALHSIRRYLIDSGVVLVDKVSEADTIIEIAVGALSIDNSGVFIGVPAMGLPVPLAGQLNMPEITLYKSDKNRSIAKFSVSFRDAKDGTAKGHSFTSVGTAWSTEWTILILFDFSSNDLEMPKEYESVGDF